LEKLARDKPSSLFGLFVGDEEKKVYRIDPSRPASNLCNHSLWNSNTSYIHGGTYVSKISIDAISKNKA
jgi:hypothetical protein